jgi:hypothetical protein
MEEIIVLAKQNNFMENLIKDFLNKDNIFAVVGVSRDSSKYGNKIYADLKQSGYKVYPINPNIEEIFGDKCYPSLDKLPLKPDVVDIVVPPRITEEIIKQCKTLGITNIWLQPGSESEEAIKFCQANNMKLVSGVCVMAERNAHNNQ